MCRDTHIFWDVGKTVKGIFVGPHKHIKIKSHSEKSSLNQDSVTPFDNEEAVKLAAWTKIYCDVFQPLGRFLIAVSTIIYHLNWLGTSKYPHFFPLFPATTVMAGSLGHLRGWS